MLRRGDDPDGEFALGRVPGRFYVSRRFPPGGGHADDSASRMQRFAYQVMDENGEVLFESENGWEVVLRETHTRQQLKALFFEDTREVAWLSFQRFNAQGDRLRNDSFYLEGDEVRELGSFLALIRSEALELAEREEGLRLLPEGVDALLADARSREAVYQRHRDAFAQLLEADVDAPEVIAFARRRAQLQVFRDLLEGEEVMAQWRARLGQAGRQAGVEDVWQRFFEENHWIFGTGLAPQFLHAWDPDRLEQTVVGPSISGRGKRPDAVMRTAGALSGIVFVEIKAHETPLLHGYEYRPGAWRVSGEVAGGVAQCQVTVDEFARGAARELVKADEDGYRTGDRVFVCRPRSLRVVGRLGQFVRRGLPHVAKFEAFERFRRSLGDPEIVTFDELYERAAMMVEFSDRRGVGGNFGDASDGPGVGS